MCNFMETNYFIESQKFNLILVLSSFLETSVILHTVILKNRGKFDYLV